MADLQLTTIDEALDSRALAALLQGSGERIPSPVGRMRSSLRVPRRRVVLTPLLLPLHRGAEARGPSSLDDAHALDEGGHRAHLSTPVVLPVFRTCAPGDDLDQTHHARGACSPPPLADEVVDCVRGPRLVRPLGRGQHFVGALQRLLQPRGVHRVGAFPRSDMEIEVRDLTQGTNPLYQGCMCSGTNTVRPDSILGNSRLQGCIYLFFRWIRLPGAIAATGRAVGRRDGATGGAQERARAAGNASSPFVRESPRPLAEPVLARVGVRLAAVWQDTRRQAGGVLQQPAPISGRVLASGAGRAPCRFLLTQPSLLAYIPSCRQRSHRSFGAVSAGLERKMAPCAGAARRHLRIGWSNLEENQ